VGEGTKGWRADTERRQYAQEENDVPSRPEENRCCSTGAMGEGEGYAEEIGLGADM